MARIMVINDTLEILDLFHDLLTEEGHEVFTYSYAIQDLAEVERIKPDLVIVDYIFGAERQGWQMVQKLKMHRPTMGIPLLICTAAVQAVREMEGYLQAKGIGLVLKPFDIDDLLRAVTYALELPDQSAALSEPDETENQEPRTKNREP